MLTISSASKDDFSIRVLKQIAWFQNALADTQQSELDAAELASVRTAILRSLKELKALSSHLAKQPNAFDSDCGSRS